MRARNIKPGFFKNENLGKKDPLARILFAGLWSMADREGRLEDRPARIKAEILPYDTCDIENLLSSLAEGDDPFILRYESGGHRYIQIIHFLKHQNPHLRESRSTLPAPDKHSACTSLAPDMHQASTVSAQCKHQTSMVQAPDQHSESPADSLIPDSLIPDSLIPDSCNSLSYDKQPPASIKTNTQGTDLPEKNHPSKGNHHFLAHIDDEKLRDEIRETAGSIDTSKFNPYRWCQAKFSEGKFNPGAILHTLKRIAREQNLKEDLWPYANKIYDVEYGNFNERDHIARSRKHKEEFSKGEFESIGTVLNRLARPP
jgi:hypothetical protein